MNLSYDFLFHHSKLGIAFKEIDGRCFKTNDMMCELLGYSHEELQHNDLQNLIHPDDLKQNAIEFVHLLEGDTDHSTSEIRYIHKTGNIIWVSQKTSVVRSESNEPEYLIVQIQDITKCTHRQTEEIMLETEKRYQRLLMFLPEPIIVHGDGIILYANTMAAKLLKAETVDELIGKSIFNLLHPDHHIEFKEIVQQLIQTDEASEFKEKSFYCITGELTETEISSIRIDNFYNNPVFLSVLRDITERKEAEKLLVQSEKLSVIGQLAAGVAHEIRNPLTALKGFTQILKSKFTDQEIWYFDIMQQELDRINLIVNDFMTLAKPNMNEFNTGSVNEILQNVISVLETQAIMTSVNINKNYSNDLPSIYCDANQLKQVFLNIIKNAIEAMPDGGDVTIFIEEVNSGKLHIQIQDQGIGIPSNIIRKIGEPFFTTKEKGTGLGLMITQRIIEAHRGSFHISSNETGTTVDVYLPNFSQLTINDIY